MALANTCVKSRNYLKNSDFLIGILWIERHLMICAPFPYYTKSGVDDSLYAFFSLPLSYALEIFP